MKNSLQQRRRKAANEAFQKAKKKEDCKIKAGKWVIENYEKKGNLFQVWWCRCHWYFCGRQSGSFRVLFKSRSAVARLDGILY